MYFSLPKDVVVQGCIYLLRIPSFLFFQMCTAATKAVDEDLAKQLTDIKCKSLGANARQTEEVFCETIQNKF